MRRGEKGILLLIGVITLAFMGYRGWQVAQQEGADPGIPFYSTASAELGSQASALYHKYQCRECHILWSSREPMAAAVPAPSLDGIGALRSEEWLYAYFSAENPQDILPSRLKQRYQMPSYAFLPEQDRRTLAAYFASLQVQDWYLEEVKKAEYEKLTGKDYPPKDAPP
jgi:hypothetical protein